MLQHPIEKWIMEKDEQLFEWGKEFVKGNMEAFFKNVAEHGLDLLVKILPDIVGYSGLAVGAMVMLNTLVGRGLIKPLGFYAGILIATVSVMEVA